MNGKLVYGVGVCTKGECKAYENGNKTKAYYTWKNMLKRCYSPNYQAENPTYIRCKACDEWLDFQVFAKWFEESYPNDGGLYQLDKDLKVVGNKVYSPKTCLFVSGAVNKFTTDSGAARGESLVGSHWFARASKFQSYCNNPLTKKREHLGLFTDELSAHLAWRKRKSELACELAMTQSNPEVRDALLRWKDALDNNEIHKI
jgi:hypothetical protein